MARPIEIDPVQKLAYFLLSSGIMGVKQKLITTHMQNHMTSAVILHHLNEWKDAKRVQKFSQPSAQLGGRPRTIWRATSLLLKLYPEYESAPDGEHQE